MKKFLDLLLIVLLTVLVINIFSADDKKELNDTVLFNFSDNSYTIPASVWVDVVNNTTEILTFNTCSDINIKYAWENLVFSEDFCKDISINSWEKYLVDYSSEYENFENVWKYNLQVKVWEKEFIDQLELNNSGSFKKIFVTLFYAPIYNLMIFLLSIFSWVFGWAIVWITVIIRIILLWPQHKMMISQRKLQAIQPKIKEIQEQYKGNQQMLWMKMMELYKKEKVNPVWSCWFLFIQMPILLVIYNIILWIKDPSSFFYVYSFLRDFDLNSINFNFYGIDLLSSWWIDGLILALIVASIQFFQIKLSLANNKANQKWVVLEKKKWKDSYSQFMPDPEMMNKFMLYWMPAMVWVFTFTLFAWVWIYWGISTLFMLWQQLIVNKKIEK